MMFNHRATQKVANPDAHYFHLDGDRDVSVSDSDASKDVIITAVKTYASIVSSSVGIKNRRSKKQLVNSVDSPESIPDTYELKINYILQLQGLLLETRMYISQLIITSEDHYLNWWEYH